MSSARPGWQTDDLAEEWIEEESRDIEDDEYGARSVSLTEPLSSHLQTELVQDDEDEATVDLTSSSSHVAGTVLVREDVQQAPLFPKTPGSRGNPGLIQTFFTPSKLERMFEPPTPPLHTMPTIPDNSPHQTTSGPIIVTSPSTPQAVSGEGPAGPFTFSMPRSGLSVSPPFAQSTPHPPPNTTANDTPLRLFQFNYDTYTRDHLSALVDSIAPYTPGTASSKPTDSRPLSRLSENSTSHLRSTKRLKLSPKEDLERPITIARPLNGKDYVNASQSLMQQIRQKAMNTSTMSTVISSRDVSHASRGESASPSPTAPPAPAFLAVPSSHSNSDSSTLSGSTRPSSTASTYRQRGHDLLAQIRSDMKKGQKRIFSGESDVVSVATAYGDEKENQKDGSLRHKRTSSSKSNQSVRSNASRRSPRPRPAIPSFAVAAAAPPVTQVYSVPSAPDFGHLVPQPEFEVGPHRREDMHRYVSSSTNASGTTLTTGTAASYMKHAGPAQIRTIAPGDVPGLPEKLGGMVFDKILMKWVRTTVGAQVVREEPDEEDPFGDFESLRDETQSRKGPPSEVGTAAVDERLLEQTADVFDELEEEEMDLTSFEADGRSLKVVPILTGDLSDSDSETPTEGDPVEFKALNEGFDSTFESDDDGFEPNFHFQEELEMSESETDESVEDIIENELTLPASASMAEEEDTAQPVTSVTIEDDLPPPPSGVVTPPRQSTSAVVATPIIRSALKNTSRKNGTPYPSAAKSNYRTPKNQSLHRRSVSFSDGKRDGPIQDANFLPSARTRRIADALENALDDDDESDFLDDSPSKQSTTLERPTEMRPLRPNGPVESASASSTPAPSRRFARSQSFRSSTGTEDVEPFEKWQDLSSVDLSSKGLDGVARLKEWTPRLERLELGGNTLTYLTGIPKGVRRLGVQGNLLDGGTSWKHLGRLERLDVSGNRLDSLTQFSCLPRLRELRADDNQIRSLEGLEGMAHLTRLSVARNAISSTVDFSSWEGQDTLEVVDLSGNRIGEVKGLSGCGVLAFLNLDENALSKLPLDAPLPRLRVLRLSGNKLRDLTSIVSSSDGGQLLLPNLKTLYADENRLGLFGGVKGKGLGKVESLSLRNQRGTVGRGEALGSDVRDVKRMYLSGNDLSRISGPLLSKPTYNLTYLELAGCRLTSMPFSFGSMTPNLRMLNLNYNFLGDDAFQLPKSTTGKLERLRKVSVVGAKVGSVKTFVRWLEGLVGDEVEVIDFRMNPCTLGWYLPLTLPSSSSPDTHFRRSLPDSTYVGRLAYRGLVMRICGKSLNELDGVGIGEKERVKVEEVLRRVGR
ncbi:hypothetical protein DL96DRAFT_1622597 [Flagelloscypha sp. PMI_526]|nr:hypothetical protein DL96DRAFT_1622597 [Flagelloscypha sp. PMI_526]